jgi:tetratricopeptide (TPR) repeat protein
MSELDRLIEMAQRAEPEPLDEARTVALVGAARAPLNRLVAEARSAEPEPLSDLTLLRMARHAAVAGGAQHRSWTRRRVMLAAGVAAAIAASLTLVLLPREDTRPIVQHHAEPGRSASLELASGDRLVAASGARFHVELERAGERRVRLERGAMLFDVRAIEGGRFSVATPAAEVVVLGTVFSVRTSAESTTVYVYEGRVEVRGGGRVRIVNAGGTAHLGGGRPAPDELAEQGERAAQARAAVASAEESTLEAEPPLAPAELAPPEAAPVRVVPPAPPQAEEAQAEETPPEAARPSVADARAWIASGDAARALLEAQSATRAGDVDPWRMVEGDALRALGRASEAADAYHRASEELASPRRQQAGFLEARLRASELGDSEGALRALHDAGVSADGSPLRERGLSLEAQLLSRLGRTEELAQIAELYLRDYPNGPQAVAMRAARVLRAGADEQASAARRHERHRTRGVAVAARGRSVDRRAGRLDRAEHGHRGAFGHDPLLVVHRASEAVEERAVLLSVAREERVHVLAGGMLVRAADRGTVDEERAPAAALDRRDAALVLHVEDVPEVDVVELDEDRLARSALDARPLHAERSRRSGGERRHDRLADRVRASDDLRERARLEIGDPRARELREAAPGPPARQPLHAGPLSCPSRRPTSARRRRPPRASRRSFPRRSY